MIPQKTMYQLSIFPLVSMSEYTFTMLKPLKEGGILEWFEANYYLIQNSKPQKPTFMWHKPFLLFTLLHIRFEPCHLLDLHVH